jgi:flagellar basal-body rod protein FlgG
VGYKADRPVFSVAEPDFASLGLKEYPRGSPGNLLAHSYVATPESFIDMSGGELHQTGGTFDLALETDGFFTVQGEGDQLLYTRDGQFRVNAEGTLVTRNDQPVLGERGEIKITSPNVRIDASGQISVDDRVVDKLRIEQFDPSARLDKVGSNMFAAAGGATSSRAESAEVVQGALEQSNADPVRTMIDLISVQRNFESFTKVVASIDDLDKKVNSRVKL